MFGIELKKNLPFSLATHFFIGALCFLVLCVYVVFNVSNLIGQATDLVKLEQAVTVNILALICAVYLLGFYIFLTTKKSLRRHESLADLLKVAVGVTDKEGDWLFLNKKAEEILVLDRSKALGKRCNMNLAKWSNFGMKIPFAKETSQYLAEVEKMVDAQNRQQGYLLLIYEKSDYFDRVFQQEVTTQISGLYKNISCQFKEFNDCSQTLAQALKKQSNAVAAITGALDKIISQDKIAVAEIVSIMHENALIFVEHGNTSNEQLSLMSELLAKIQLTSKEFLNNTEKNSTP